MASKAKSLTKNKSSTSPSSSNLSTISNKQERKSPKLKIKKDATKTSLAYKIISEEQTKLLLETEDVDALQSKMAEVLQMTESTTDLKESACLDYYVAAFWWAKEQGYSSEQLSAFFTVIHTLFDNIKEKHVTVVDNLREFKKMLAGIGKDDGEISGGLDGCFDLAQARSVTDYAYTSIFQHHNLYEYMFTHNQAEDIIGTNVEVEIAPPADMPWPPPLEEAVMEDIYKAHIAPPPPEPTQPAEGLDDGETAKMKAVNVIPTIQLEGVDEADRSREADLLAQLSPDEVRKILTEVFDEMLGGLKAEVAAGLREKENSFISRINKVHKVA